MRLGQAKLRTRTKDVPTFLGVRNGHCVTADLFCHISTCVCSLKSIGQQQPKSMHCNAGRAIDSWYYFDVRRWGSCWPGKYFGFRKKDGNGGKGVSTENWESLDKKNRAIAIGRGCPKMRKLETEIINGECSQLTSALPTCASHDLIWEQVKA